MPGNDCNRQPGGLDCSRNSANSNDCSNALRQDTYFYYQQQQRGPIGRMIHGLGHALFGSRNSGLFMPAQQQYLPQQFVPAQYMPRQAGYPYPVAQRADAGIPPGARPQVLADQSTMYDYGSGRRIYIKQDGTRIDEDTNHKGETVQSFTEGKDKGSVIITSPDGNKIFERGGAKGSSEGWKETWSKMETK